MDVYWLDDNTWHLHEHFENLYEVGETTYDSPISVEGQAVLGHWRNAQPARHRADGVQLCGSPLIRRSSNTIVYNNHYFLDPNTRRIITHKVRDGETHLFQIQDFARVQRP